MDIVILKGVSGSGKSTFAEILNPDIICCADTYFMVDGEYRFDAAKLKNAHEWCFKTFKHAVDAKLPKIVVANTNTAEWEFKHYEEYGKVNGYRIFHVVIENRHGGKNVHSVPDEVLERQKNKLKGSIRL